MFAFAQQQRNEHSFARNDAPSGLNERLPVDGKDIFTGDDMDGSPLRTSTDDISAFIFPVAGHHAPCEKHVYELGRPCGNRSRSIEYVPSNSGMKLICGRGHNVVFEGKQFIPSHEFGEGGAFASVKLPSSLQPPEAKMRKSRWSISSAAFKRLGQYQTCASCGVEQFDGYKTRDSAKLLQWLFSADDYLGSRVKAELREKPGINVQNWFSEISAMLGNEIMKRSEMSIVTIEHGIAKKLGNAVWYNVSRDARSVMQELLLFPFCRRCNLSKGAKRLPIETLERLYVQYNYDGSRAQAVADKARWAPFQEVITAVYQEAAG